LLFLQISEKTRYIHTIKSEKLYFELNSRINPKVASGKIIIKVITFTILCETVSLKNLLKIKYKSCPPSSDITGRILNSPTEKFAAAKYRK
jgi:hypothetical protein